MQIIRLAAITAIFLAAACAGKGGETAATADTTAVTAPPPSEARRAADIANAISANPDKADSILTAHGVTAAQLEEMMFRIARDSALSAEYGRLTAR